MKKLLRKINIFLFLYRALKGEVSLPKAFYVIYVFFGAINLLVIEYIFKTRLIGDYIRFDVHNHSVDMFIALAFPYLFLNSMCVWACGKNSWIEWNLLSKIIVSLPLAISIFHLIEIYK